MTLLAALGCGGREGGTNPGPSCNDNGTSHPSGTTWTCSDGCNVCGCSGGLVESTLRACSQSGPEGGVTDGPVLSIPPGTCTTTSATYTGNLGGIAGADQLCQVEMAGSHFYVQSRDGQKRLIAGSTFVQGMGEVQAGSCWDCDGWTRGDSGPYHGTTYVCPTGYESVAALVPWPSAEPTWRICEGGNWPLTCCTDN